MNDKHACLKGARCRIGTMVALVLAGAGVTGCGIQSPDTAATAAQPQTAPSCSAGTLTLSSTPLESLGGSYLIFTLTNTGTNPCSATGAPRVAVTDSAGTPLYLPPQAAAAQAAPVNLNPGDAASFWIRFLPCQAPPTSPSSDIQGKLSLTLQNANGSLYIPFSTSPGCASQQLVVSSIVQGANVLPPGFTTGGAPPGPLPAGPPKTVTGP